jgi:benzoyl-CoA reductase/2-hydroxyglutaryl-CoA dehydratase subunit BcrC/BadD/HgdB
MMINLCLFIAAVILFCFVGILISLNNRIKELNSANNLYRTENRSLNEQIEILGDLKLSMQNLKDVCELTEENRKLKNKLKQSKTK